VANVPAGWVPVAVPGGNLASSSAPVDIANAEPLRPVVVPGVIVLPPGSGSAKRDGLARYQGHPAGGRSPDRDQGRT
jgi:hypothetical protein